MSTPRFNHVFLALMSGAFLSAFVLPANLIDPARVNFAGVFNPISYPLRRLARAIYQPTDHPITDDTRSRDALLAENDRLRQEIARLDANVQRLQGLEAERQKLGDLQSLCVRVHVTGNDSGGRDGLSLAFKPGANLSANQAVLYAGGLAGRLQAARGAARVRLITDEGCAVTGAFIRFIDTNDVLVATRINAPTPLVKGIGQGRLEVVGMTLNAYRAAALRPGDWVVLDDPQWPKAVQGVRLGQIISAQPAPGAPLYVRIQLAPESDLTRLSDVWVLAKD